MTVHDFISLIGTLAWPLLIVGLVIAFRKPLRSFASELTEVRVAGQEFVRRTVDQADLFFRAIPLTEINTGAVPETLRQEILGLAANSPQTALICIRHEISARVGFLAACGNWGSAFEGVDQQWRVLKRSADMTEWSEDTQVATILYGLLDDAATSEDRPLPESILRRLVDQGLTVLGLVRSIPYELRIVVASDVQVFADTEMLTPQTGRRAVILDTHQIDGVVRRQAFLTTRPHFYCPGMAVGYGWRKNPPPDEGRGWVRNPADDAPLDMIGWDFWGRDLSEDATLARLS